MIEIKYNRDLAVEYANIWAYERNPRYYDFSEIGGDCTNFASQCLYAGCDVMNYTPVYGWYYENLNNRAPAWTSVVYFHRFLINNEGVGPFGVDVGISKIEAGDFVQLRFRRKESFGHTPIIVKIEQPISLANIYVAAHSFDADYRPLNTYYNIEEIRYIHILGARKAS